MTARALLLTGTVGVGKTTVAAGDLLREREVDLGFSTLVLAGVLETAETGPGTRRRYGCR